jgi:TIR domain
MNSNQTRPRPHFLRLVDSTSAPEPITHETFARADWKSTLFVNENPALILFVSFQEIDENDFTTILTGARPKSLYDLRRVPRFDLGTLNRRQAFSLFSELGIQYVDLSRQLNTRENINRDPVHVAGLLADKSTGAFVKGPIALLVDPPQFEEKYITSLVEHLPATATMTWDILRVPFAGAQAAEPQPVRSVVFISHANPEDNAFVTWLAGQLAIAGYSVWSDVTRLVGAEIFWDDIEETIRSRTAKFVTVLSKAAQLKPGVLDEIDLAVRVERAAGLNRFVVPVRLDNLPSRDLRANIARRNVIDFSGNWALGLQSLLGVLERDRVPRNDAGNAEALSHWAKDRLSQPNYLLDRAEVLTTNWLPISQFPKDISLFDVSAPVEQIDGIVRSLRHPSFRYLRLIGSFAGAADLQSELSSGVLVSEVYRVEFHRFLAGAPPELPGLPKWEAGKLVTSLLRQTWDFNMKRLGLQSFETSSGQSAWYMPAGFLEADRVEFFDREQKKRRKSLVGWSERRKVFWHFAVEAKPVLTEMPHYLLKEHIIFTTDGLTPIDSKEKMHLLRRRFCKSWWNDRWRDMLIAFTFWLSQRGASRLAVGAGQEVSVDNKLMALLSPVSIATEQDLAAISYDQEDQLDTDEEPLDEEIDAASESANGDAAI